MRDIGTVSFIYYYITVESQCDKQSNNPYIRGEAGSLVNIIDTNLELSMPIPMPISTLSGPVAPFSEWQNIESGRALAWAGFHG